MNWAGLLWQNKSILIITENYWLENINGLVQERCNSITNALELCLSCTNPSIYYMLFTAQLPGPVLKAFGRAQFSPLQLADKSPMITDQHTAGGAVSQLSQLAKLSPWLTLSTKYITTSFWHYKKWFCFLSNQIMGLYHFSNPTE